LAGVWGFAAGTAGLTAGVTSTAGGSAAETGADTAHTLQIKLPRNHPGITLDRTMLAPVLLESTSHTATWFDINWR
jgi:hypothetical protein